MRRCLRHHGLLALLLYAVFSSVRLPTGVDGLAVFAQATEATIDDLLFLGAAVFFLGTLENRLKSTGKRSPRCTSCEASPTWLTCTS